MSRGPKVNLLGVSTCSLVNLVGGKEVAADKKKLMTIIDRKKVMVVMITNINGVQNSQPHIVPAGQLPL